MTLNELNVDRQSSTADTERARDGMSHQGRHEFFVSLLETAVNSAERRENHFWMRTPETFS